MIKIVKITNKEHPHFEKRGAVIRENVIPSIPFLGLKDIVLSEDGSEFLADKKDYELIINRNQ
jgi:hypothetical protein